MSARTERIELRVTPEEKAGILRGAALAGLDVATWLRVIAKAETRELEQDLKDARRRSG